MIIKFNQNRILNSLILMLIVVMLSPWTWYMAGKNLSITVLLIFYSFSLIKVTFDSSNSTFVKFLISIIFLVLSSYAFITGFDKKIWQIPAIDIPKQQNRHRFYAAGFGKLYTNKFVIYYYTKISPPFTKIQSNLFSNLDVNNYFFASGPRERTTVSEFEKYPFVFLPFFFYGLYAGLKKKKYFLGLLFLISTLAGGFILQNYPLGPFLFMPLVNTIIVIGLFSSIEKILPKKIKKDV